MTASAARAGSAAALVLTTVAALLVLADVGGTLRSVAVLLFLAVAPGWALLRALGPGAAPTVPYLVVPASLAVVAAVAGTAFYLGAWEPETVHGILAVGTAAALVWDLVRTRSAPDDSGGAAA
jgi:hypothetical protein